MEEEQKERFREAVERKAEESEAASRAREAPTADNDGPVHGDQADPPAEREKSSRHGKVTADKWNQ